MFRSPSLEDELGDVLEKALKVSGMREDQLAGRTGINVNRIKDALDYRYDLTAPELRLIASVLELNEPGLLALAADRYPQPEESGLPFCMHIMAMPYGVGVVNAYLIAAGESDGAVLIDSGTCARSLREAWPDTVRRLSGHLVTHWDSDHAGGCLETMSRFGLAYCLGPGPSREGARVLAGDAVVELGGLRIEVISTPGPSREHYCYLAGLSRNPGARRVLFSGDLFFCGSIGGGFFDTQAVLYHARRLWRGLPGDTVVAPGHGPLTTIETEREFNPFASD
ncbi:MAG TPA: MBL fold metallo-hydrolase [Opitutaceae bacterium]